MRKEKSSGHKIHPRMRNLHRQRSGDKDMCFSCTTFNILAPIYKRIESENCRESQYRSCWYMRNQSIIDRLLADHSSVICLQEVWLGNDELVGMYETRLSQDNYSIFKLARTNNRGDGLLTAVHKSNFRVLNYRELLFNDFGDRVAQLLHVESVAPSLKNRNDRVLHQMIIVNTHLLFPHDSSFCIVRLKQVYKILKYIEDFQRENMLGPVPVMLCGDWNGSKRGNVYKFLQSQGFLSSYDTAHQCPEGDADTQLWVSHRNHRGNICGVDFIWLRNPNKQARSLKVAWNEAVFGIIKNLLHMASLSEESPFALLKADEPADYITYSNFFQALGQLGLLRPDGLTPEETQDLWNQADVDGNGVMDYEEYKHWIWDSTCLEQPSSPKMCYDGELYAEAKKQKALGFKVKDAVLFPPEVEKGTWPENYNLSDHAPLTVVFSPVRVAAYQPVYNSRV